MKKEVGTHLAVLSYKPVKTTLQKYSGVEVKITPQTRFYKEDYFYESHVDEIKEWLFHAICDVEKINIPVDPETTVKEFLAKAEKQIGNVKFLLRQFEAKYDTHYLQGWEDPNRKHCWPHQLYLTEHACPSIASQEQLKDLNNQVEDRRATDVHHSF